MNMKIVEDIKKIMEQLTLCDTDTRVKILNEIHKEIRKYSPFQDPVDLVEWVKADKVQGNDYNPNKVAPPEMKLLEVSILEDGFTQPIVAYKDLEGDKYTVVDGFHRLRVGRENKEIYKRMFGYLPIVVIDKQPEERIASTIRHNRARGKHGVAPMSDIVAGLAQAGWENDKIAHSLGMDADEILRLKQRTGIAELFKNREFTKAWIDPDQEAPIMKKKKTTKSEQKT
jgi:ParB-like chromosome segregation protein Spo0J